MWVKVVQTSPNNGDFDPVYVPLFSYATTGSPQREDILVSLIPQFDPPKISVKMPQGEFSNPDKFWAKNYQCNSWDGSSFGLDDWHHLAITGDPASYPDDPEFYSRLKIYVDGVSVPSPGMQYPVPRPLPAPGDGGSVVLGQGQSDYKTLHHDSYHVHVDNDGNYYDNYITFLAEVRFWNLARSPDQIFANYLERCTSLETRDFPHPCLCTSRPVNKNETSRKVTLHAPIPHPSRRITASVPGDGLVAVWSLNCNFNDVVGKHCFGRLWGSDERACEKLSWLKTFLNGVSPVSRRRGASRGYRLRILSRKQPRGFRPGAGNFGQRRRMFMWDTLLPRTFPAPSRCLRLSATDREMLTGRLCPTLFLSFEP